MHAATNKKSITIFFPSPPCVNIQLCRSWAVLFFSCIVSQRFFLFFFFWPRRIISWPMLAWRWLRERSLTTYGAVCTRCVYSACVWSFAVESAKCWVADQFLFVLCCILHIVYNFWLVGFSLAPYPLRPSANFSSHPAPWRSTYS